MRIALTAVFVAVRRHRGTELGGVIRLWPVFGLDLGISVVASPRYSLPGGAAFAVPDPDFALGCAEILIARQTAKGASADALAASVADMERCKAHCANPLYRTPVAFAEIFPDGVLVALGSVGRLCNARVLPARRG